MRNRTTRFFLCFALILSLPAGLSWAGTVIHVPGDRPTIQAGIDAAATGDTVLVASGTYIGPGNRDLTFGGRNIVLMSVGGPSVTTIDCQGLGRGISLDSFLDDTAVVDGFTITNGSASLGGGISVRDESSPTVTNCSILGNSAALLGGGVFVSDRSSPTFMDCTIRENNAQGGGGIRVGDLTAATFVNCVIAANTASQGGGVIANDDLASRFADCTISGNMAEQGGGLLIADNSLPTLEDCTITGNLATNGGGLVINNSSPTITRCTVAANHALLNGGGMYVAATVQEPVTRTIVWSNCADVSGDQIFTTFLGSVSFACSDVDDSGVEGNGTVSYDANTIHVDPLFCKEFLCTRAPTSEGDYTLDDNSPALAAHSPCGELIGSQPQGCTGRSFEVVGGGQYERIQDAIDRSVGGVGDTILVDDDTWTGPRNTELDFGGRNILLKSRGGSGGAVIDGGNAVRAIVFQNGEDNTAVVEGFTLTRGAAEMPGSIVLVKGGSSPVFRDCVVKNSKGVAGVVRVESGSPLFEFCTIEEDTITTMSMDGVVALVGGSPSLESCVVRNNAAPVAVGVSTPTVISATQVTDNGGYGVYFDSTPSSLVGNSEISRNADRGVVLDESSATFDGVVFRENGGGGVVVTGLSGSSLSHQAGGRQASAAQASTTNTFTDCEFSGHSTDRGAGFYFDCTNEPEGTYTLTFTNCRFTGNHATFEGGGVAICGRATNADITPLFVNCTIAANSAQDGGGIYMGVTEVGFGRSARAEFSRTILWGNCSTVGPQGEAFVLANNEIAIDCSHASVDEIAGTGVINTSQVTTGVPLFCDFPGYYFLDDCQPTSTTEGNFSLSQDSPAAPENHPCGPEQIGAFPTEACAPTAIGDKPVLEIRTELRPPAPNPFNPVTTIEFTLEAPSHVVLTIYDVRGRLARRLLDGSVPRGVHRIEWDGQDESGNPAASGVYFLRFETGQTAQTHKMVLLK